MSRVTSLTNMPDAQLNRWIKRLALLLLIGIVAFIAFYAVDRFRMPTATIVDRELAAAEEAVRADPADTTARGRLADAYFEKGRVDEAISQYTMLLDANKEVYVASLRRGQAYERTGQYALAIPDYEKVVEIGLTGEMKNVDPTLAAAYYGLGKVALAENRHADAIESLKKALAIQRTDGDTLYALATAYLATDQPEEAIKHLTLAVTLVPVGWPEPYQSLETAYTETGDAARAEWAGAMAAFAEGDTETAMSRLEPLASGELALEATVGLGLASEAAGDTAAATDWYTKALAIDPENMTAKLGLGRVSLPKPSPTGGSN